MKIVDVSGWQADREGNSLVDWQGLVDAGIKGVIIKLGENLLLEESFISHVNKAVEYGLDFGVYYYSHAATVE